MNDFFDPIVPKPQPTSPWFGPSSVNGSAHAHVGAAHDAHAAAAPATNKPELELPMSPLIELATKHTPAAKIWLDLAGIDPQQEDERGR